MIVVARQNYRRHLEARQRLQHTRNVCLASMADAMQMRMNMVHQVPAENDEVQITPSGKGVGLIDEAVEEPPRVEELGRQIGGETGDCLGEDLPDRGNVQVTGERQRQPIPRSKHGDRVAAFDCVTHHHVKDAGRTRRRWFKAAWHVRPEPRKLQAPRLGQLRVAAGKRPEGSAIERLNAVDVQIDAHVPQPIVEREALCPIQQRIEAGFVVPDNELGATRLPFEKRWEARCRPNNSRQMVREHGMPAKPSNLIRQEVPLAIAVPYSMTALMTATRPSP